MGQLKSAFSCVHVWREKVFLSCDLLSNNKMAVISKFERGKALGMIAGGMTRDEVSWRLGHLSVRRLREMLLRACFPSKRCGKKPMLTKAMKARSMGVYFS